jgi:hypothetical protein
MHQDKYGCLGRLMVRDSCRKRKIIKYHCTFREIDNFYLFWGGFVWRFYGGV